MKRGGRAAHLSYLLALLLGGGRSSAPLISAEDSTMLLMIQPLWVEKQIDHAYVDDTDAHAHHLNAINDVIAKAVVLHYNITTLPLMRSKV